MVHRERWNFAIRCFYPGTIAWTEVWARLYVFAYQREISYFFTPQHLLRRLCRISFNKQQILHLVKYDAVS